MEQESIRSQFAHALASEHHCAWKDVDPNDLNAFEHLASRMEKYENVLRHIVDTANSPAGVEPYIRFLAQDALA